MVGEYVRQYGANATGTAIERTLLQTLLTIHQRPDTILSVTN